MEAIGTSLPDGSLPRQGSERFAAAGRVELTWWKYPGGLRLLLQAGSDVRAEVALWLGQEAWLSVHDDRLTLVRTHWHMLRGFSPRVRYHELFAWATCWVHRELYGWHPLRTPAEPRPRWAEEVRREKKAEASRTMRAIYRILRDLAVHAASQCDQAARGAVLAFCPHLRFRLYQRLVGDAGGRLLQLSAACPGVLIFALALIEQGGAQAEVGEIVLRRVQAGVRLPRLLDEAVQGWAAAAVATPKVGQGNPAWLRLTEGGAAERERICRQQKLLIRRAGPRVPTTLLWLPPPLAFAPEDIPRARRANARWYKAMKEHAGLLASGDQASAPMLHALSLFVSRQAENLFRALPRRQRVRQALGLLYDYLLATRRRPGRERDPAVLLGEAYRWHERLHGPGGAAGAAALDPVEAAGLALPTLPDSEWSWPGIEVRPLRTALDLAEEGRRMHHCVATRLSAALAGSCYLYGVQVEGEPLTVEVQR
ncbi:MAG: hypothetical protein FJ125_14790, partial [Deltaproteobacteria bacterium]|nr:hypothetical protein [Deltaproteobacteria bacterium]